MIERAVRVWIWVLTGFAGFAIAACSSINAELNDTTNAAAAKAVKVDPGEARRAINEARRRHGAPPLTAMPVLRDSAESYSMVMARKGKMAHSFGPGTHLRDRLKGVVAFTLAAENLGAGQNTVERLVQLWLESPGHRRNLLDKHVTHFGLGRADNPTTLYKRYWTLILIRPAVRPTGTGDRKILLGLPG